MELTEWQFGLHGRGALQVEASAALVLSRNPEVVVLSFYQTVNLQSCEDWSSI